MALSAKTEVYEGKPRVARGDSRPNKGWLFRLHAVANRTAVMDPTLAFVVRWRADVFAFVHDEITQFDKSVMGQPDFTDFVAFG